MVQNPFGGIVLYSQRSGDTLDTPSDVGGKAITVRTLTASNWIASPWFYAGAVPTLYLVCGGVISAGMASVVVRVERERLDTVNTIFRPSLVDTVRMDAPGSGPAIEQTILKADLLHGNGAGTTQVSDWDGTAAGATAASESLDVVLATTDGALSGRMRVLLLASNAPQAGDKFYVTVERG